MTQPSLLSEARTAMKKTDLNPEVVATRAKVSVRWLYLLKAGELTNPSVKRLERVMTVLGAH
jgi:hypothetical protein